MQFFKFGCKISLTRDEQLLIHAIIALISITRDCIIMQNSRVFIDDSDIVFFNNETIQRYKPAINL